MKTVLTIAGFDPSSGAGVTADVLAFAAHGLFGTSCITSLTVQSTKGVRYSHPIDAQVISDTLDCLEEDISAAGIKIGMLGTKEAVQAVCGFLEALRARGSQIPVVVDPVLRASSGSPLLEPGGAHWLRTRLFPLADWVTPNCDELSWLTTLPTKNRGQMLKAAVRLQQEAAAEQGSRPLHVLAKGGDMDPPDDLLHLPGGEHQWIAGQRVVTTSTHGTGCALSSALLSRLVLGDEPMAAARNAKEYVAQALRRATPIGHGRGPLNHLWPLR